MLDTSVLHRKCDISIYVDIVYSCTYNNVSKIKYLFNEITSTINKCTEINNNNKNRNYTQHWKQICHKKL